MSTHLPRFILAGLSGGSGKTIVSLALARAFRNRGLVVAPFKKGPDYIDAKWLALAADRQCSNLDPYFHTDDVIRRLFWHKSQGADLSLIEGNRGLFDGLDEYGSCSTAELSRKLDAPVVLVIDCTKMTRTVAAIVQGCADFENEVNLKGVILNRTAGERHRAILQKSIETHTDVKTLGMLPKLSTNPIPERHMGLVFDGALNGGSEGCNQLALTKLADLAEQWLDMDAICRLWSEAPDYGACDQPLYPGERSESTVRIGYVHDAALWFYYPENLEALEHAGAELLPLSILDDRPWPEIDGLYLGGGFPEVYAERISQNHSILNHIKALADSDVPIYAECGGFMVLCDYLECDGVRRPMAKVFPVGTSLCKRPQGLGYTKAVIEKETPFYAKGSIVLGHEFHYSICVENTLDAKSYAMRMLRGNGIKGEYDGLLYRNTYAGYNHMHSLAAPHWAERFVNAARRQKPNKRFSQ